VDSEEEDEEEEEDVSEDDEEGEGQQQLRLQSEAARTARPHQLVLPRIREEPRYYVVHHQPPSPPVSSLVRHPLFGLPRQLKFGCLVTYFDI
jgi:hypothetical protein